MKISRFYLLSLLGLGLIIWSLSSSCSSKQVSTPIDPTFKNVSSLLVSKCAKCHGDSTIASHYGGARVYDFSNYYKCIDTTMSGGGYFNTDSTNYDPSSFGGDSFLDIQRDSTHLYGSHSMPLGGPRLNEYEIEAIRNWLFKGAPNN